MDIEVNAVDPEDETRFGGPFSEYPNLTPSDLQEKVDEGFAELDNQFKDAPTIEEFINPPKALDPDRLYYAGEIVPVVDGKNQIYITHVWYEKEQPNYYEEEAFEEWTETSPTIQEPFGPLYAAWGSL